MKKLAALSLAALAFLALATNRLHADMTITLSEVGSDVVYSYTGTLDLTGGTLSASGTMGSAPNFILTLNPGSPLITSAGDYNAYTATTSGFGTSADHYFSSTAALAPHTYTKSGDFFGLEANKVLVPTGFTSGTITGSVTFNSTSFASLGITPGSYTNTITGAATGLVTLNAVPEPSTYALLAIGVLSLAASSRLGRRYC